MQRSFILDFWTDDGWFVGNLREVPNVFSQGKSLEELKTNIQDAIDLWLRKSQTAVSKSATLPTA